MEEVIMTKPTEWKLLIATSDESEAYLLKHRLVSEGIQCRVRAENTFPGVPHGGRTKEIQVYVPVTEFEASQLVIESTELGEYDQ
jgi:hypothetical protein